MITAVLGEQRGDEGKGRFVDVLAEDHDIVARFNGGNNAGHTVLLPDGRVLKLHSMPSGIAHKHIMNIIGNGCLINPVSLLEEINTTRSQGIEVTADNMMLSMGAHLILPHHISEDEIRETGRGGQGSTKSGIAQVARDKYARTGVRVEMIKYDFERLLDIVREGLSDQVEPRRVAGLPPLDEESIVKSFIACAGELKEFIGDTVIYLHEARKANKRILAEGAQAFLLDIDHGMYPYVTSSTTTAGGVAPGLGVAAQAVQRVIGVSKVVQSHVGGGPFVTEITDEGLLQKLHGDTSAVDAEFGTTTGRIRRLGYLDLPSIRRAQIVNGTTEIALTKLDWLPRFGGKIPVCVAYTHINDSFDIAPDSAARLVESVPVYEELAGWSEDISHIREFKNLPENAQAFVKFIEQQTGLPVTMIGVGPERSQVILRSA